jgi:5,10-methylenetetrahydromethanopterin reductase
VARIGVRFEPDWPPEQLPEFARWAEREGYDELWFSEDLPWAGGIAMAAVALTATERLRVGLGLLPAATRNVATAAMEIGALGRIAPGRLTVALGHGVPAWMQQIGVGTASRLPALQETVVALRRLLAGERVSVEGRHVRLRDVQLGHPPALAPQVLVGTTGPIGVRLAGSSSDGLLLPEVSSPDAVRWAREEMNSAGDAGSLVVFAMASVDSDRDRAHSRRRPEIQRLVDLGIFPRLSELAGLGADGRGEITDQVLKSLSATGTPAECAQALTDWFAAGADCVVLLAAGDDSRACYREFADEVLPLVR